MSSVTLPAGAADLRRRRGVGDRLVSFARQSPSWTAGGAIGATFGLLIALPLGLVLVQAFIPNLFDHTQPHLIVSLEPLLSALTDPRLRLAILHSLLLAAIAALTATALGASFAILLRRTDVALRTLLALTPWLVFLTPGYLKALAWVLLMSPNGYLAQFGLLPESVEAMFFGLGGLVFVHTLNLFPLAYFIIDSAIVGLGSEYEDAARTVGASARTAWLRINLPLLGPAIVLAMLAIFSEVLADFGMAATIARTIDFGLLTYGIYTAANDFPVNFALAGSQSLVLLAMTAAVVVGDRLLRRQRRVRLISGRARPVRIYRLGWRRWTLAGFGFLIFALAVAMPLLAIILRSISRTLGQGLVENNLTSRFILQALSYDHPSNAALLRSLGFAAASALLAAVVAVLLAYWLDRAKPSLRQSVLAISLGSIAIPGIVLGFGYILMWDRLPGFRQLPFPTYGAGSLLVTGYIAAALPYALVIVLSAMGQISPSLIDAARLHGADALTRLVRIVIPLIAVSILTAGLFVFLRTIFELPISQLLMPKSGPPAPAMIVRLFGNDDDGIASALSLFSMAAAGIVGGTMWLAGARLIGRFRSPGLGRMVELPRHR